MCKIYKVSFSQIQREDIYQQYWKSACRLYNLEYISSNIILNNYLKIKKFGGLFDIILIYVHKSVGKGKPIIKRLLTCQQRNQSVTNLFETYIYIALTFAILNKNKTQCELSV